MLFRSKLLRPAEVDLLCGDATKAREKLGWQPRVTFEELVWMMVEADLETLQRGNSSLMSSILDNENRAASFASAQKQA